MTEVTGAKLSLSEIAIIILIDRWSFASPGVVYRGLPGRRLQNNALYIYIYDIYISSYIHIYIYIIPCTSYILYLYIYEYIYIYRGSPGRRRRETSPGISHSTIIHKSRLVITMGRLSVGSPVNIFRDRCKRKREGFPKIQLSESLQHCCSMGLPELPESPQP